MCQASLVRVAIGSDEVFCKSVETQPGRAHTHTLTHTHTHTHLAGSATDRPLSTPPQLSQFTELCHRTSPASFSPPRPLLRVFSQQICSTVSDWQEEACRRAVSYHLQFLLLLFRRECLKLLRLPSRPERSAEPIFPLRAPEAIHGAAATCQILPARNHYWDQNKPPCR